MVAGRREVLILLAFLKISNLGTGNGRGGVVVQGMIEIGLENQEFVQKFSSL